MKHRILSLLAPFALIGAALVYTACGDDDNAVVETTPDAGPGTGSDGGTNPDGGQKDCFDNPTTHFEIINACTTATRIDRPQTKSSKLQADGGLPKP
jgi:hypothetical protein